MEIISELESHTRGAYCGSVFVLAGNGWMQSSIAIRTLEINDQHLHCWGWRHHGQLAMGSGISRNAR